MATITLKSQKEPIIVDRATAEKIKQVWFDEKVPMSNQLEIGELSCLKSEIKQINLSAMAEIKREDHWVIQSFKRNSIWKQTFSTYEEAKAEYDYQMGMLHPEIRDQLDWKIVKKSSSTKSSEDKSDFGGF